MSLSTFADVYVFLANYRLNHIAESIPPPEMKFESLDHKLQSYLEDFLGIGRKMIHKADYYKTDKGLIEWLGLLERLLDALKCIINVVGTKSAQRYEDKDVSWAQEFAVHSMLTITSRAQISIRKERGILKKRLSRAHAVRETILVILVNIGYNLLSIVDTVLEIEKGEKEPKEILKTAGEALYVSRNLM